MSNIVLLISLAFIIFIDLIIAFLFKSCVTKSINSISISDLNNIFIYKYISITGMNFVCSLLLFFFLKKMAKSKRVLFQCLAVFILSLIVVRLFI